MEDRTAHPPHYGRRKLLKVEPKPKQQRGLNIIIIIPLESNEPEAM